MNSVPSFDKILNTKKRLEDLLNQLEKEIQGTRYDRLITACVQDARQRLDRERFVLAFVGDWNSGKSSLINRLLFGAEGAADDSVLPVKDESTTSRATIIRYGESAKLFLEPKGAQSAEDLVLIAEGVDPVRGELRTHGAAQGEKGSDKAESYNLVLEWPSEILRDGLIVVDTPGLSDPEDSRSEVTMAFVRQVDGVVVVAEAGTPFTTQLWAFLKENVFDKRMKRFFFLMNKIDAVTPGEKEEKSIEARLDTLRNNVEKKVSKLVAEFKEKFQEQVPDAYGDVRHDAFFAVSAKTGENLETFLETLEVFARKGKLQDCYKAAVSDAFEVLLNLESHVKDEEDAAGKDVGNTSKALETLESNIPNAKDQQRQMLETLEGKINASTKQVHETLTDLFDGAGKDTVRFLEKHKKWLSFGNNWQRLWPANLAKEASAYYENQKYELRKALDGVESSTRRDLEQAIHQYAHDIKRVYDDLGFSRRIDPPKGWRQGDDGVWSFGNYGASDVKYVVAASFVGGIGGTLWGVSQGVFTAIASSTLPGWVPGASWLATHGLFTATASTTAWASVASTVLWPAGILGMAAQGYLNYRSRKQCFKSLDELANDLKQKALTVPKSLEEEVRKIFGEIRDIAEKGFDDAVAEMRDELKYQKEAAERKEISQDAQNMKGLLVELRENLEAVSGELER